MKRLPTLPMFAFALIALSTSCGGDGSTEVVDTVVSVLVNPATATLGSLGATTQLTASAAGSGGPGSVSGTTFSWSSSNDDAVTVSANGLATAVANGSATITATAVGTSVSGTATITVAQVAASITVTPEVGMLPSGETLQLTATATDAGGSALAAPNLAWSSSDDAVATVDATGLVSGVNAGAVVITAAQDGASDSAALDVIRADLMPTADLTLGGTVRVGEVMIPAGVTVTLSDDLVLDAVGPVVIAGDVIGDCLGLSITGQDAVTISGTFSNACGVLPGTEDPPALSITGNAVVNLEGATITSSGNISISNVLPTPSLTDRSQVARSGLMEPELRLDGTTIQYEPGAAPGGEDMSVTDPFEETQGGDGKDGKHIDLEFTGQLLMQGGTVIQAQDGGRGGDATVRSVTRIPGVDVARGGDGGAGGNIELSSIGSVIFLAPDPSVKLLPGDGGRGGDATGTGEQNPDDSKAAAASAFGGKGGRGGEVTGFAPAGRPDGTGGRGGNATAIAATGVDATPSRVAQEGGDAAAQGGMGGSGGEAGAEGNPGAGGDATAVAGSGGGGEPVLNRDGADGGTAAATGGSRGLTAPTGAAPGGNASVSGGNGGDGESACLAALQFSLVGFIYVFSDPALSDLFIFAAGLPPGIGLAIVLAILQRGGNGGDGGMVTQLTPGADVAPVGGTAGPGFNGGNAGAGSPVGVPGNPGALAAGNSTLNVTLPDLFQPGQAAGSCFGGTSTIVATVSPAATGAADRTITLTGNAPWIAVTGTVADDGTVTASGRGVMNFTPNVLVQFNGTFDEVAGTLDGTYTMDPEKIISAQHPLVYSIDVSVPAQSSAGRSGENR